jgi:thiol peroxidase
VLFILRKSLQIISILLLFLTSLNKRIFSYFRNFIKQYNMAHITLGGNPITTIGELPAVDSKAKNFTLTATDLSTKQLSDFSGKRKILNIFPSIDTGVCATSTRKFNQEASALENTVVLCISRDVPFAHNRFCAAEGLENVVMLSDFKTGEFGKSYGLEIQEGGFEGLHSRAIVVLDENDKVLYTEQVPEIGQEPDYSSAIKAL